MARVAVYTCITGSYDEVKTFPLYAESKIDYFLFTNNRSITSDFWSVVYIDDEGLDNIRLARKIKVLGHPILASYDVTVWMDGASYARAPITKFLSECCDLDSYSLVGFAHRERDCIYDEALECVKVKKDKLPIIAEQVSRYKSEGYPSHAGLIESTVIVRRGHDEVLDAAMFDWFEEICRGSYRDQLSFNYVARRHNLNFRLLPLNVFDNDYFGWESHRPSPRKELQNYSVYFDEVDKFDFDRYHEGVYECLADDTYRATFSIPVDCKEFKLEFAQFAGIEFDDLKVECPAEIERNLVNWRKYGDQLIFDGGVPTLFLFGRFKEGQQVSISIRMKLLSVERALECMRMQFEENVSLLQRLKSYEKGKSLFGRLFE